MSIASLVLGIIGIVSALTVVAAPIGWILVTIGLIIGIVDVVKKGKIEEKRGVGIAGTIICGVMFVVLLVESIMFGASVLYIVKQNENIDKAVSTAKENQMRLFNESYVRYEGVQTGIAVKALIRLESTNRSVDEEHSVIFKYDGNVENISEIFTKIDVSKTYNVSLEYDEEGYVKTVKITPVN